jgi:hypothetical protein
MLFEVNCIFLCVGGVVSQQRSLIHQVIDIIGVINGSSKEPDERTGRCETEIHFNHRGIIIAYMSAGHVIE